MSANKIAPLSGRDPIVNAQGMPTAYFDRFMFDWFRRIGGYVDVIYAAQLAGNLGDANLAELTDKALLTEASLARLGAKSEAGLEAQAEANEHTARQLANMRAFIEAAINNDLEQQIADLRALIHGLRAQLESVRGEDTGVDLANLADRVSGLTTTQIPEDGSNLYFTAARAQAAVLKAVSAVAASTALTAAEANSTVVATTAGITITLPAAAALSSGGVIRIKNVSGGDITLALGGGDATDLSSLTVPDHRTVEMMSDGGTFWRSLADEINFISTAKVPENIANLYYSDARARNALGAGGSLSYNSATGIFSITVGTAANYNTGTSGNTIPLLDGTNTWANTQTFSASPILPTASAHDNSTKGATTAYVDLASLSQRGRMIISVNTALTTADRGKYILVTSGATVTLPTAASMGDGGGFIIKAVGAGCTIAYSGGNTGDITALAAGKWGLLLSDGTSYYFSYNT